MSKTDPNGLHYDIMNLVFCDSLTGFIIDFNTAEPTLYKEIGVTTDRLHLVVEGSQRSSLRIGSR